MMIFGSSLKTLYKWKGIMKKLTSLIMLLLAGMSLAVSPCQVKIASAETREIVGMVWEYSPGGEMIQIGDYTMKIPAAIYLDDGTDAPRQVDVSQLRRGQEVQAFLVGQDASGFEIARKLIILGDSATESNQTEQSDENQSPADSGQQAEAAKESGTESEASQPASVRKSEKLKLEGGVWTN